MGYISFQVASWLSHCIFGQFDREYIETTNKQISKQTNKHINKQYYWSQRQRGGCCTKPHRSRNTGSYKVTRIMNLWHFEGVPMYARSSNQDVRWMYVVCMSEVRRNVLVSNYWLGRHALLDVQQQTATCRFFSRPRRGTQLKAVGEGCLRSPPAMGTTILAGGAHAPWPKAAEVHSLSLLLLGIARQCSCFCGAPPAVSC